MSHEQPSRDGESGGIHFVADLEERKAGSHPCVPGVECTTANHFEESDYDGW